MPIFSGNLEIKPYIKYNAKADKWFIGGLNDELEEIRNPKMIMDLSNLQTGWLAFYEGQAPSRVMDPDDIARAVKPDDFHKRGFVVLCQLGKSHGGAVVEFSSNSMHAFAAIGDLYAAYGAECQNYRDKLPLVECTRSEAVKDKYGTNYRPVFSIVGWVDRPGSLPDELPVDVSGKATAEQPKTKSEMAAPAGKRESVSAPAPKAAHTLDDF